MGDGVLVEVGVMVGVAVSGISVNVGVAEDVGVGVGVGVFVSVGVNVEVGRIGMFVRVGSCFCFSSVEGQGIAPPAASKHPPP